MPTGSEFSEGVAGRYAAEKAKIKAQQALRLKTTMAKLVGDFDHSDVLLEASDGRQLPAHLCILKNRAPGFYKSYLESVCNASAVSSTNDESGTPRRPTRGATPIAKIRDVDYSSLKFFLRCIYTAEEVPAHPTMCGDAMFSTSSMSSSGYDPTPRDNYEDNNEGHRTQNNSIYEEQPSAEVDQQRQQPVDGSQTTMVASGGSAQLVTSVDSHGSGRTYILDDQMEQQARPLTSSQQSTPAHDFRFGSPDRGTRALTISAYSSMSDSVVEPLTNRQTIGSPTSASAIGANEQNEMMTSFAELAVAATTVTRNSGDVLAGTPESLALTTSMDSDDQNERGFDSTYTLAESEGRHTVPRRHRADHMIAKFIRVDGLSSSSEQSPQQPPPADKKIFPMFIEMSDDRPSRLSLCESETIPLSVAAAAAVRRTGSGCTIDSPARSQMGRKRWSVTSLRSIDSADLASPLSSRSSVVTGLDEENQELGSDDGLQGACSRLGKDLLTMLMDEKDTDLTIVTKSGQLKAHRCILATSCPYFKAMLNGDWLENRNSVIELNGFADSTVMCALRVIYGGVVDVPENVSVWELISFADMIQLDDLKQVAYLHIRGKYCHFFHKPCSGCVNGVLECLPFLHSFGVEDLLERCRQWQAKYFARIWKTKMFNLLSEDLLDLCYRSVVNSMAPNNILDIMLGCEKLQLTLPRSKSSEAAGALVACLTDAALEYLSLHLDSIVESPNFASLGKGYALNLSLFEDLLPSVVHSLSPDVGCLSLIKLYELMTLIASQQQTGEEDWNDRFINLLRRLYELCDTHLIHYASAVVRCDSWKLLTPDMQRRIKENGIFVDIRQPKAPPPRLSSFNKSYKRSSSSADRVRDRSLSIHRFRPPPPLTEYPSKSNVAEASSPKAPSTQVKSGTFERKKHRRQSPAESATSSKAKDVESKVAVEKEPEPSMPIKRSSTTDLTPGEQVNANVPVIDDHGAQEKKQAETLGPVENVLDNATAVDSSQQSRVEPASDSGPCQTAAPEVHDENSKPNKEEKCSAHNPTLQSSAAVSKKSTSPARDRPEQKTASSSSLKQPQQINAPKGHQSKPQKEQPTAMHRSPEITNFKKVHPKEGGKLEDSGEAGALQPDGADASAESQKPEPTSSSTCESGLEISKDVGQGVSSDDGAIVDCVSVIIGEGKDSGSEPKLSPDLEKEKPKVDANAKGATTTTSSDRGRAATRITATVSPSVSTKKTTSSESTSKPMAKVAGVPKTSLTSNGTQSAQHQRPSVGSSSTTAGSTSSRASRPSNLSSRKPKSTAAAQSPMRKGRPPPSKK